MNPSPKSLQETADDLCSNLASDQTKRRDEWIESQRDLRRRLPPGRSKMTESGIVIAVPRHPNLDPADLNSEDLNTLTHHWVQTKELPRLLKNGAYQIEARDAPTAPAKPFDPDRLTSSVRINPEDGTVEVWSSAMLRKRKHPPTFVLFGVKLLPKGAPSSISNEIEVWGIQFRHVETTIGIAEKLIHDPNLRKNFSAIPGNNVKLEVDRFCDDFKKEATAAGWERSTLKRSTLYRGIRDARKNTP